MPRDFNSEQEIEVARDDARGVLHPIPAVNLFDSDPVLRVLVEARTKIATDWYAGSGRAHLTCGRDPQCASNTIYLMSHFTSDDRFAAMDLLARTLTGKDGDRCPAIWKFNDTEASHDQVVALFNCAISSRRAELEGVK